MPDKTPGAGFSRPGLTKFCGLDELGLEVVGQRLEPNRAMPACRVVEPISGALAAAARAPRVTPSFGSWPTSRWAGAPQC